MTLFRKLANPFALTAQGFTFGAILFFSAHPDAAQAFVDRLDRSAAPEARAASPR
jgi:hypothetical protein